MDAFSTKVVARLLAGVQPGALTTHAPRNRPTITRLQRGGDLIEVMTGARPEEVRYDIQLPDDVVRHLQSAERLRARATAAQSGAAAEVRAAARTLAQLTSPPSSSLGSVPD